MKVIPTRFYKLKETGPPSRFIARVQPALGFFGRLIRR